MNRRTPRARPHRRGTTAVLTFGVAAATLPAVVLLAACATVLIAWLALLIHGAKTGRYPSTDWGRFEDVPAARRTRGD